MHPGFPLVGYKRFAELPLEEFNHRSFSVYILDFEWNYLYINAFVRKNLGSRAENLVGKNMWEQFPTLKHDIFFTEFKSKLESKGVFAGVSTSPITGQKLNVAGYALEDCYYCTASILPNKDELISDLRKQLVKSW